MRACNPHCLAFLSLAHSHCTQEFVPVISIIDSGQVASDAQFVGVEYVPDTETVCIAASTGEVFTFSVVTNEVCVCVYIVRARRWPNLHAHL